MSMNGIPSDNIASKWSLVLQARRQDTARAVEALGQLGQAYWFPIYAYLRQRGHSPEDAKDLTREFYARLLQNKTLSYMKRDCGKLRSFLLSAVNHFLTDEGRKGRLKKTAASQGGAAPEQIFEQNWALAVLNVVYDRLTREYQAAGKAELFTALKFCLTQKGAEVPYADLARRLSLAEEALRAGVTNLHKRFGEVLREEVASLVATPADMEEELRCLFCATPLDSVPEPA
jgi:DNA-directed RNA polymerase specialized sigma24 family protein